MPKLWRLYRAAHGPGLDGTGGLFAEGRWHHRGERAVYFGTSAAIVVLELLAHTDPDLLPADLRLAEFEYPGHVSVDRVGDLPAHWVSSEDATRRLGTDWRIRNTSSMLAVPSAVLPEEQNVVLNPQHPDAASLQLLHEREFHFDSRLL